MSKLVNAVSTSTRCSASSAIGWVERRPSAAYPVGLRFSEKSGHEPRAAGLVRDVVAHEVGERLVEPGVLPPLHRHQVAEPHVGHLVGDHGRPVDAARAASGSLRGRYSSRKVTHPGSPSRPSCGPGASPGRRSRRGTARRRSSCRSRSRRSVTRLHLVDVAVELGAPATPRACQPNGSCPRACSQVPECQGPATDDEEVRRDRRRGA